jgi:amidase
VARLMPGYQAVAPKHDSYGLPIYTALINLLDYPAGILTHGRAEREADKQFLKEDVVYDPACKCYDYSKYRMLCYDGSVS